MLEIERILDNKPVRPPMISTLAMRGLISHGELNFQPIHLMFSVVKQISFLPSHHNSIFVFLDMFKVGPEIVEN